MASDPFTDRTVLTTRAYADPERLVTRYSLYRYRQPPLDLHAVLAELMRDVPGPVLDIGCGPGRVTGLLRADRPHRTTVAVDLSPGMVARAGGPALLADVTALPVPDGSCGGLLAAHMLYHVPDPEAAVRELARAKASGGTVLISTNAEDDKAALHALCRAAIADVPGAPSWPEDGFLRFPLDAAEAMARRHFADVRRIDLAGEIVVPDPEPVATFVASLGAWLPPALFDAVLDRVRHRVAEAIARDGAVRFGTHVGILVCR